MTERDVEREMEEVQLKGNIETLVDWAIQIKTDFEKGHHHRIPEICNWIGGVRYDGVLALIRYRAIRLDELKKPFVKENAGKTAEVLSTRIKVARHDTLYLNCPWCDGRVKVLNTTVQVDCPQCGLTIQIKKVEQ